MKDIFITVDDLHSVPAWNGRRGFCNEKSREFLQRHGLSWNEFIKDGGIWASKLEATNDALALQLVEWVRDGKVQ